MRWVALLLLLACAMCGAAFAQEPRDDETPAEEPQHTDTPATRPTTQAVAVTWNAPEPLRTLYRKFIPAPQAAVGERRAGSLRPWEREVRKRLPEIAAAEGWFSATVAIDYDNEQRTHVTVTVTPGPRTVVESVDIAFRGDLMREDPERDQRRRELRESFVLKPGQPFRSAQWDIAKTRIEESLGDLDYAAGILVDSKAEVDAESAKARLFVTLDSGPQFTLGGYEIEGLQRYPDVVIKRLVDLKPGERYRRERLFELQHDINTGPWFSSVIVDIERDPMKPNLVPVKITVSERPTREVGLALGYGTDDGVRGEAAFRHRNLFDRGFDLQSSVRVSQEQQIGYADVYLPPGLIAHPKRGTIPFTDSFGVLTEHSTIEKLALSRFAVAAYRHFRLETWELRLGLSYQIERTFPEGGEVQLRRALAPIVQATFRHVDNVLDPKKGGVLNVQVAAGAKSLASGDNFVKLYGQYTYWIPLGDMDQLTLRTEWGRTFAPSRDHIPQDFLYRAGGSRSNRGYAYQSLGPVEGDAVVGGRYLATGTVEYTHWLNDKWGAALFLDVGDAADSVNEWQPLRSYGVGARYKTPAGPFALDLAYAEQTRKFRLAFSVTVAF
jgi:translocation and assembly module TamA